MSLATENFNNDLMEPSGGSSSASSNASDYEVIQNPEIFGLPIQIVKVTDERKFELDVEALGNILLRDSIRDTPVVVVSIAGDFRKGKSFMLNHFLRYLQSGCGGSEWLVDSTVPLKGFSWRGGCQRDTTGILMWSEPFVVRLDDGREVAIVLMDTQGAFDSEYTVKDSATVFALSTMTSSIQVFNLMHNLQEDNLQVLEIFLEYGRLALESVDQKPFQKLMFLIRDWSYPYEHPYGFKGGEQLLDKKLELKDMMPEQLQRVRRKIKDCFGEIGCFLMPHPGSRVATNPEFDGRTEDYDKDFLSHLKNFVPDLLAPNKLIVKQIGGRAVTGRELLEYFKVYITVFSGDTMPEPKTMFEATAEANNLTAVAIIKDTYVAEMENICGGAQPFINPTHLEKRHQEIKDECMEKFDNIRKMGGEEFSVSYREKLDEELNQAFEHFAIQNRSKNVFGLFGTPLILLFACFICLVCSRFFDMFGLQRLSNTMFTLGTLDLGLMILYVTGRYSGNYPEFISFIDNYAEMIWLFSLDQMQNLLQNQTANILTSRTNVTATAAAIGTRFNRSLSSNQTTPTSTSFQSTTVQKRNVSRRD
ncbi:hypothetical protein RDWZM_008665 [Blomia tropicalis]|uniref:GB1/RHD3-type G domain-containing protein n=1 Tax=Blomia tropicalis TaxID=40697 RepID=A0A9Q0RJ21_BLOTA|nr:hypothetical protein RDWZM_008665 [Blomia tropicalis]